MLRVQADAEIAPREMHQQETLGAGVGLVQGSARVWDARASALAASQMILMGALWRAAT